MTTGRSVQGLKRMGVPSYDIPLFQPGLDLRYVVRVERKSVYLMYVMQCNDFTRSILRPQGQPMLSVFTMYAALVVLRGWSGNMSDGYTP